MAKTIYTTRNGEKVALSSSEVKSFVMRTRGWTSEEYNKQYDKLRNRTRAYEAYQKQAGVTVEAQSAAQILYYESKAMKRYGKEYQPSLEIQRLKSFPSVSSGKALENLLQNEKRISKLDAKYGLTTEKQFAGLIKANSTAAAIMERISNPVQRERALSDYANKIYVSKKEAAEAQKQGRIPFGQAVGSDSNLDFDITEYMSEEDLASYEAEF